VRTGGQVKDLMAALEESVQKARASRGEATVHDMPKKKAAKKTARKSRSA
jgi:DNA end-binding protein Ku